MPGRLPPPAKTTRPNPAGILPRPRLFRLLDRARRRPVVWVTGPPGAGKTSLVTGYLAARRLRSLWYQLDEGDGDVATFYHYLGLAAGRQSSRRLRLPPLTPERWLRLSLFARDYFRALYAGLRSPFVLVLDNYHEVPADALFHDIVHDGLGELPPGGRVLVLSRSEPPPALARLRASDALEVVGWGALRLTLEEARGIARQREEGHLPDATVRALHATTEGWAAGLVLMLAGREAGSAAPRAPGSHGPEAVFDYFAGQVFRKADPETQRFLLETAFLPSMTGRMAAELTGLDRAERILADLCRRSYFTERRAQPEPVFQYHALFRLFLRSRAIQTLSADELAGVQRRAATLSARAGQVEHAVGLLREAGDWEGLARVITREAPALLAQGRSVTLEEWIAGLPPDLAGADAWVQYWLGTCRMPFDPARGRSPLERAFQLFRRDGNADGAFSAWCGAVGTILYEWGDFTRLDTWIRLLDELCREYPSFPSPALETRVASTMFGALAFRQPDHPEIARWADRAFALSRASPDVNRRMLTGFMLATYHLWIGNLARAALVIESLRPLARSRDATPLVRLTWALVEAYHGWQAGFPEESLRAAAAGLETAEVTGVHLWDSELLAQGAYAALTAGDVPAAQAFLQRKAAVMDGGRALDVSHYHYLSGWVAVLQGDLLRARECVEAAFPIQSGVPFPLALNHLALAQVLHESGEDAAAAEHLEGARRIGRAMGSRLLEYMCALVEAHVALARGRDDEGLAALARAMALGRDGGYVTTAWWRPGMMAELCARALAAGIEPEYVRELVRRRRLVPDQPPLDVPEWPWPLRVHTLGGFRLEKDGRPVEFTGKAQRKPMAMLEAIVAFGGRGVHEPQLAEALWPDAEGDAAHQAFATTLHRLRRLVGQDDTVALREGRVSLDSRRCWVDVWAFEALLDQADAAEKAGNAARARTLGERALALYRGPFLGPDSPAWAVAARERLRRRFLRGVGRLGRHSEDAGEWRPAIEWYEKGLEVDELAEEFYQRLMACYQRLGRRAEALSVYERCRVTLAATLGVTPSSETDRLYRALRAGASPPGSAPAAPGSVPDP